MAEECKFIYFYRNGHPCEPKKIMMEACQLTQVILRDEVCGNWTYEGKNLYTLTGEKLFAFRPTLLPMHTAYVMVGQCEKINLCVDYMTAFVEMLKRPIKITCNDDDCGDESEEEEEPCPVPLPVCPPPCPPPQLTPICYPCRCYKPKPIKQVCDPDRPMCDCIKPCGQAKPPCEESKASAASCFGEINSNKALNGSQKSKLSAETQTSSDSVVSEKTPVVEDEECEEEPEECDDSQEEEEEDDATISSSKESQKIESEEKELKKYLLSSPSDEGAKSVAPKQSPSASKPLVPRKSCISRKTITESPKESSIRPSPTSETRKTCLQESFQPEPARSSQTEKKKSSAATSVHSSKAIIDSSSKVCSEGKKSSAATSTKSSTESRKSTSAQPSSSSRKTTSVKSTETKKSLAASPSVSQKSQKSVTASKKSVSTASSAQKSILSSHKSSATKSCQESEKEVPEEEEAVVENLEDNEEECEGENENQNAAEDEEPAPAIESPRSTRTTCDSVKAPILKQKQNSGAQKKSNKMSCGKENESINLFFFENGKPCNPQKVTKKRGELASLICKGDNGYTFCGKTLYDLKGKLVCKFCPMELPCDSGYVLVANCEKFKCADYESAYQKEIGGGACPAPAPACPATC